jgi:hypothetical protein
MRRSTDIARQEACSFDACQIHYAPRRKYQQYIGQNLHDKPRLLVFDLLIGSLIDLKAGPGRQCQSAPGIKQLSVYVTHGLHATQ